MDVRITTPKIPIEARGPLAIGTAVARRSESQDLPAKQGPAEKSDQRRKPGVVDAEWAEVYDARALPLKRDRSAPDRSLTKANETERLNPYEVLPPGDPAISKYSDIAAPNPSPPGSIISIFA